MIHIIVRIFEVVGILGCVSSSIYYLLCLWSALVFLRARNYIAGSKTINLGLHFHFKIFESKDSRRIANLRYIISVIKREYK